MPKRVLFLLIIIFFIMPCFAERKTRVDKYDIFQCKIVWSSKYSKGPGNFNYAKVDEPWVKSWSSILRYYFILNPNNSSGVEEAFVTLYSNDRNYMVDVWRVKEGVVECIAEYDYNIYQYNSAKYDFDKWANLYEMYITFDEMGR